MPYHTVFDIAVNGYKDWTFPAHGLIFIVAGILAWRWGVLSQRDTMRPVN